MKKFLFSLIFTVSAVFYGFSVEDVDLPGYRASYLDQMLEIDHLAIVPQKGTSHPFFFTDTNVILNRIAHKMNQGAISFSAGMRRLGMEYDQHYRPYKVLYGVIGSSFAYAGIKEWNWTGSFSVQPDLYWFDLSRTTRYMADLHGRYHHSSGLGIHVGAYLETGMRVVLIQPIIGADYKKGAWLYQAIFPLKAGASYMGLPHHTFSFMIRPIYTVAKVQKRPSNRPLVMRYRATGAEVRWDLSPNPLWNLWISIGSTVVGTLTTGDRNFHHTRKHSLGGAPYAQIGFTLAV